MPRHLQIVGGPLVWDNNTPSTLHNYHMQCGDNFCNDVVVTIQNVHNSNVRFSNLTFSPPVTTTTINLVAVNGAPPSFTYLLTPGQTLTITLRICTMVNSLYVEEWKLYLFTVEHGQDPAYYLPLEFVDPFTLITPSPIDFGLVPFPGTGSVLTTVNNVCYHEIEFNGDVGLCEGHDITFSPNGITIPALMSAGVTVNWTPMSIGEFLQCFIYVGFCNGKPDIRYELMGTAVQDCSCLCCNDVTIGDENGFLRDQNGFCGNTKVFKAAAIVERKFIKYDFSYNTGLTDGVQLFFNPWLFSNQCSFSSKYPNGIITQPPAGYFIEFNEATTPVGGSYQMQPFGLGSNEVVNKNWEVYFTPIDVATGQFNVLFNFFMLEDLSDWLKNAYIANMPKWRRGSINDVNPAIGTTAPFPMASSSVYNATKKLAALFYLVDPNTIVDGAPFECFEENCINYQARFYNKGLLGGPSELIDWAIKFERNGVAVANFSTLFKTKVIFTVTVPPAYSSNLAGAIFQVFDESQVENGALDFLSNYNSSRANITNVGGVGPLDNLLETPSTFTPLGGGAWEVTAYVNTLVVPGNVYRVAVVAYADDTQTVNTFLSDPITVTQTPEVGCDFCTIQTTSKFQQFFQENETDCLQPTAKERIRHQTVLENGDFKACLAEWGYMGDWLTLLKTITLNIYRVVDDFPNPGQTMFCMFEQHVSNRVAGFPGGWQNLGGLTVADNAPLIETDFTTRVGFENTPFPGANVFIANTATYMQRNPAGVLGSTYVSTQGITNDWRDGDVWFEYIYTFDLSAVFGVPFELNQVKGFMVAAIENEPDNSGFSNVLTNAQVFAFNELNQQWEEIEGRAICAQDYSLVRAVYTSNQNGDFSFYVTKNPETMAGLMENNPIAGPLGLPQLTQTPLVSMDADYSNANQAVAVFPIDAWTNGTYNLCGLISIPPAVFICEYFKTIVCQAGIGSLACSLGVNPLANLVAVNASNGRYRNITFSDPVLGPPIQGNTYVLEYNLISGAAPTKEIHFWAGKDGGFFVAGSRPSDGFIPIGATSGAITFVWGGSVSTYVYFQLKANANPNWTGTMEIKIGNTACP